MVAPIILRPYEEEAVDSARELLNDNVSTLIVQPTGTGKTITFAEFIRRWNFGRVVVMAHRDELIRQAADKIERVTGEECDIEMAEYRADQRSLLARAKVVITSVQTMSRKKRQERFDPLDFGLLIIDEAHHAVAPTYKSVIDYFRKNEDLRVLGVTATPDRADELALGRIFETVACDYQLIDAIRDGWLVPIQQQFVHVEGLDLSGVKTTAGDLNQGQLAAIVNEEKHCHRVVAPIMEISGGAKTLVFATTVRQAETMCEIANRHSGGCADWICGNAVRCPRDRRREALADFAAGEFNILFNVGILLEGYDEPGIEIVACARPTKSRSLYSQMLGRGTRTLPGVVDGIETAEARRAAIAASGKTHILVLDFVGNSGQHKLIHAPDILGGDYDDEIVAMATSAIRAKGTAGERADIMEELREAAERHKEERRKKREKVVAKARYSQRDVDPFDVLDLMPKREPGWHKGRKPTDKQRKVLENAGVKLDGLSFCKASQLIGEIFERRKEGTCSLPQAKLLARFGESPHMTFVAAKERIDAIKRNGWKPLPK